MTTTAVGIQTDPLLPVTPNNILRHNFKKAESVLNVLGYIPGVSVISGTFRFTCGGTAVITSLFLATIYTMKSSTDPKNKERNISLCLDYAMHGTANMLRGTFETAQGFSFFLIMYDLSNLRFSYAKW